MMKTIIAAVSENGVIGSKGRVPWHIPRDLQRFKKITTPHPMIMGRKTYESIGKPLPKRLNVVLTKNPNFKVEGVFAFNSLESALKSMENQEPFLPNIDYTNTYIIGGEQVYRSAMQYADIIELTRVHKNFEGDAYFPGISGEWLLVGESERLSYEGLGYTFITYQKI